MSEFLFSEESDDNELIPETEQEFWDVLIVDDEEAVHSITKTVLKSKVIDGRKLRFHSAFNGQQATDLLRKQQDFAVILLDVVMENDQAGLDACLVIRDELQLNTVRIILRTGQPGSTPEEEVILKYKINDYKEKNELTASKLFSCIVTAVRSYHDLVTLQESQTALVKEKNAIEKMNNDMAIVTQEIAHKAQLLEESNRYKSEFLANMSHELRTPLNSVLILSSLLSDNDENNLGPDQIESLNIIQKSGKELLDLIEDILALSQLETGKIKPCYQQHSVYELCRSLIEKYAPLAQEKGLVFDWHIDKNVPEDAVMDVQKVKQGVSNLLSNAIKFTSQGTVTLIIKYEGQENSLHIAVEDTGIGIEDSELKGIFESFQQVDGSVSRAYGGVGLGLTLTQRIVNVVGGKVIAASEVGKGSIFTIIVPLNHKCSDDKSYLPANHAEKALRDDAQKQVLIVDDNSRNVFSLIQGLKSRKMKIFVAENGQSALDKLAQNPAIDIILMDIMMPVMDGNTAMKAIRASGKYNELPIIAITAKTLREDRDQALSSGASECVSKPVDIHALTKLMDEWL